MKCTADQSPSSLRGPLSLSSFSSLSSLSFLSALSSLASLSFLSFLSFIISVPSLSFLLLFSSVFVQEAEAQQPSTRIALMNSQRILDEAPEVAAAREILEAESAPYQAEVDSLQRSLAEAQQNIERQASVLTGAALDSARSELQRELERARERVAQIQQTMLAREEAVVKPAVERVEQVIETFRREQGYALILDTAIAGPLIVSADPAIDVTDEILALLN